jgi:hypothetical protein
VTVKAVGAGIPSLINSIRGSEDRPPYFNQPWELIADLIGGVYRPNRTDEDIARAFAYFLHINSVNGFSLLGNIGDFTNHDFTAFEKG